MAWLAKKRGKPGVGWRDLSGKECWRTCPDQKTAKELQREIERCHALGKDWKPQEIRSIPGIREIAEDWLKACQRKQLAASTLIHYASYLEDFIGWYEERHSTTPEFISRRVVEGYFDHLCVAGRYGRTRATSTALKYMSAIHIFWEWASRREEYREFVPAYDPIELPPALPKQAATAPTWSEMDAVMMASAGWRRKLVIVLRCTGLRVQQAMGLRWENVDLERGELTIPPNLGKSRQEKAGRVIPLAPVLLDEIRSGRLVAWTRSEDGWLIECPQKDRIARPVHMERFWERAVPRRAAWEGRPFHAFRRGFVSGLRSLRADKDAVEYLVGHAMPGVQSSYVDPEIALSLRDAVGRVPAFQT